MLDTLTGIVTATRPGIATFDVQGVGYRLHMAETHIVRLSLSVPCTLYVSLVVREAAMTVYGFLTSCERDLFELFLSSSGIGPKLACNLVGYLPPAELRAVMEEKDIKALCRVPGIGKKSAERLILEIRDAILEILDRAGVYAAISSTSALLRDARSALCNLGLPPAVAERSVAKAMLECPTANLATIIGQALSIAQSER